MSMLAARKPKKWIQGAVKHPGALTAEASASGRSKLDQPRLIRTHPTPRSADGGCWACAS